MTDCCESFTKMLKRSGPRTAPCGKSWYSSIQSELHVDKTHVSSLAKTKNRFLRYDENEHEGPFRKTGCF